MLWIKAIKKIKILKRFFIVISSITLLSCATLAGGDTSWNFSIELPHSSDDEVLTVFVQKSSYIDMTTRFSHGTEWDFVYHKVAKIEINLTNDAISKTTVIENNDEQSRTFYNDAGFKSHDVYEHYCRDIIDKSGMIDCDLKESQKYNNKILYRAPPKITFRAYNLRTRIFLINLKMKITKYRS